MDTALSYTSGTNLTSTHSHLRPKLCCGQICGANVNVFQLTPFKYNALMLHVAGNMRASAGRQLQLSRAHLGLLLGELFDYVDGVCQQANGQLNAFGPGDYGPSGENVTAASCWLPVHVPADSK